MVLIGPPGAGCSSVGAALAHDLGVAMADLAELVAHNLGVRDELALVAVGEERYRRAEAVTAIRLLDELADRGTGVVALGSGCLTSEPVLTALERARHRGAAVVALTASTRCLSQRNGLNAPRSVGLGNVNHAFTQMLHARRAACRSLADQEVDTTGTTPLQAARHARCGRATAPEVMTRPVEGR